MICAICKQEFVGKGVESIGEKGAEFWECKPEEFVCFWCFISSNWEHGDSYPWHWHGKA